MIKENKNITIILFKEKRNKKEVKDRVKNLVKIINIDQEVLEKK